MGFSSNLISQLLDPTLATVPRNQLGGFATLSPWESGDGTNTGLIHSLANTNTWLLGKHNLRFGADIRFYRSFGNRFQTDIAPDFNFGASASFLRGPLDNAAAAPLGQDSVRSPSKNLLAIPGTTHCNRKSKSDLRRG